MLDDLDRGAYQLSSRLGLDSKLSRIVKQIKLLVYLKDIGALDPLHNYQAELSVLFRPLKEIQAQQLKKLGKK